MYTDRTFFKYIIKYIFSKYIIVYKIYEKYI